MGQLLGQSMPKTYEKIQGLKQNKAFKWTGHLVAFKYSVHFHLSFSHLKVGSWSWSMPSSLAFST